MLNYLGFDESTPEGRIATWEAEQAGAVPPVLKSDPTPKLPVSISETLFEGKLTLECSPAERGKVLLVARNCTSILNRDVIAISRAKERKEFIKSLEGFDDAQRKEIDQTLLKFADDCDKLPVLEPQSLGEKPAVKVVSRILEDGRIIEQIAGGQFAVYDPNQGEVAYSRKVETDDAIYRPLDDDFIARGGLFLPERLIEYDDDATLDAEIEACINRYSDVPERERRLSARYARLTYVADKLNEISYLRATGERGSGKSRYICTTGMLCLRPVLVTAPSAASLFRMMDAYQPTLTIDECNMASDSEDTQALVQILNSGFQRIASVPRVEKGVDGQQTIRMFSPFGPKLIGGLKLSESEAFESRCVAVKLQKTGRKDIPFRMTARMLADFADLRAKLYLWRLRNLGRNIEAALDQAEAELKSYQIEPRFVQIAIPIYGLIADDSLKRDFASMMKGRTDDAAEDKKESFDGQIVRLIHSRLFDVDDDGKAQWKINGELPELEEGKPCEALAIPKIVELLNAGLPDKRQVENRWLGKQCRNLGFLTKEINKRESACWKKSAIIFDRKSLGKVFDNFSLPIPQDFHPVNPVSESKPNDHNEMQRPDRDQAKPGDETSSGQSISYETQDLKVMTGLTGSDFPELAEESFSGANNSPGHQRRRATL